MTGREMALTSHSLRVTANTVRRMAVEVLGPREGDAAHREIIKLADAIENRAGRALVRDIVNDMRVEAKDA